MKCDMETMQAEKYCNYCKVEHLLTSEYWLRLQYSPKCKVRALHTHRLWKKKNPGKYKGYSSKHYAKNRDKVIQANFKYSKNRRKTDMSYRLTTILRSRLNRALKGNVKTGSAVNDLGCSIEDLKKYLESKFTNGMSWDNYGKRGWHIDHIRPLSSFNLIDSTELKQATHYTNLQPLWHVDNYKKSNKWSGARAP